MLKTLPINHLRKFCPLKWHDQIPEEGIGMGMADIDFEGPRGLLEYLTTHLKDDYNFYCPYEGLVTAIEKGKDFLLKKKFTLSSEKKIQLMPGTMLGIYAIMEYFSRKEGDIVMINPIYPPIHKHARQTGNKISWLDLRLEDSWRLNHEILKESINSNTKLLVFANPNNPTGTVFAESDLKLIRDLVVDYNISSFVDELYEPLTFIRPGHQSLGSLKGMESRCISLFGFSKAYGLAGWRSGFLYIDNPAFKEIKYLVEQLIVAPSPVTSLVMEFALSSPFVKKWQEEFIEQIRKNVFLASDTLNEAGFSCIKPQGTFFVFPKISRNDIKFKQKLLADNGIDVVAGSEFGPAGKEFIRINCATSLERVKEGIDRIITFLKK